jgi:threonine dehydrogenase-like Zn-dependent dehydrogenase
MKGLVVEKPGVVLIKDDIPEPRISEYSAILETIACGICNGTDLKIIDGHFKGFDTYPAVLGHESVGRVVEIGKKVKAFKKGDMVLRTFLDKTGPGYSSGWGSFSERTVVYDYRQMTADGVPDVNEYFIAQQVLPPDIDPVKGVMIITFKEVLTGLKSFGVSAGQSVMINGCGPVGLSMVRLAKTLGVGKLIASDVHPSRLALARELGADIVLDASKDDVKARVREIQKQGLDLFIDAVGINGLMNTGLDLVTFNGKVGVYGISPSCAAQIDWTRAPYNWTIQFVQWPNVKTEATLHDAVIEHVRTGFLDLDLFVTHVLPLEDFQKGLALVKNKEGLKVSLTITP